MRTSYNPPTHHSTLQQLRESFYSPENYSSPIRKDFVQTTKIANSDQSVVQDTRSNEDIDNILPTNAVIINEHSDAEHDQHSVVSSPKNKMESILQTQKT